MRYLITGGAGFIGGHLSELLCRENHSVVAIDNLSTGSLENIKALMNCPNFTFIQDDIMTCQNLDELVAAADVVVHLAASVGVELVVHSPMQTIQNNIHGSERVLLAAAKHHVRVVLASTSEVYGKSTKEFFNEADDLLIGASTHSRWSYACSKLLDEFYLMALYRQQKLPGTVVRFFNTVGPRQTGQYGMVIPRFVGAALKNEPICVFGDGLQSRCFCHVQDTIRAVYDLTKNQESIGQIYNIGSQESITILELAKFVKARLNSQSEIVMIPYAEAYEAGFEDMRRRKPDTAKVRSLLNWHPLNPLEKIIDDVAACLRRN